MTTSDSSIAREIASAVSSASCHCFSTPVSGGDRGARNTALSIFADYPPNGLPSSPPPATSSANFFSYLCRQTPDLDPDLKWIKLPRQLLRLHPHRPRPQCHRQSQDDSNLPFVGSRSPKVIFHLWSTSHTDSSSPIAFVDLLLGLIHDLQTSYYILDLQPSAFDLSESPGLPKQSRCRNPHRRRLFFYSRISKQLLSCH